MLDWIQFITIFTTLLAGFGFLYREFKTLEHDVRTDIKTQAARSDKLYEQFTDLMKDQSARSDKLSERTDRLYEMFIQLLQKDNPKTSP